MAFRIVNKTYKCLEGQNPERYGLIEGYTSNTYGKTYLRINCKALIDDEMLDFYKRSWGEIPIIPNGPGIGKNEGCRPLRSGDYVGEGIRLNKKQVKQLIKELKAWLKNGN